MTNEELDEGRDVIFENDDYIFMEIFNPQTARYYGPSDYIAKNWARKFRDGNLYYLIDKESKDRSIWIHIPNENSIEIENFNGMVFTLSDLLIKNPVIEKYIKDKINPFNMGTYYALKAVAQGVPPSSDWTMEHVDPMISNFKYVKGNPKNSIVTLTFDNIGDYFKTFDLSEDSIWIIRVILDSYGDGFDFADTSDTYYWDEGSLLTYNLNSDNIDKINEIMSVLRPGLKFVEGHEDENKKIVNIFDIYYPDFGIDLTYEYASYENQARNEQAKKEIKNEFCNIYEKFNIFKKRGCYWEYHTPVWNLIRLYDRFAVQSSSIEELISKIGHDLDVTEYYDYIYEVYGENFDSDGFNNSIGITLDKIIEEIENNPNAKESAKIFNEISKKYEFGKWYRIPSHKNGNFFIETINFENSKLVVRFSGVSDLPNKVEISLEEFLNLIYNYSLF